MSPLISRIGSVIISWKWWPNSTSISSLVSNISPLESLITTILFCELFWMNNWWKNLMFLSPYLSHLNLDFWGQKISFDIPLSYILLHMDSSSFKSLVVHPSFIPCLWICSFLDSKNFLSTKIFPKSSLFCFLIFSFRPFSFCWNLYILWPSPLLNSAHHCPNFSLK